MLGTAGNAQIVWEKLVREGPHGVDKFEDKGERTSERGRASEDERERMSE